MIVSTSASTPVRRPMSGAGVNPQPTGSSNASRGVLVRAGFVLRGGVFVPLFTGSSQSELSSELSSNPDRPSSRFGLVEVPVLAY